MDVLGCHDRHGILDAGTNILNVEIRVIIPDDLCKRQSLAYQLQNIEHWNSGASHTRLAKMNMRIDSNSCLHVSPHSSSPSSSRSALASRKSTVSNPSVNQP